MPAVVDDGGHARFSPTPVVRLRLDIGYDGTDFAGWATQAEQRTVAGVLDKALSTVFRAPVVVRAAGAGRTDTGVHATGQVAHVDIPVGALPHIAPRVRGRHIAPPVRGHLTYPHTGGTDPEFLPLVRRLARFLPPDIRVFGIARAPEGFDARFSALRRHYRYRLSVAPFGVAPELARYVTPWPRELDIDSVNAASRELLGLRDFAAFCRFRAGATTIREMQRLDWSREGDLITAHVTADAFCWNMVRSLVGALLAVGEGKRGADWIAGLLDLTQRSSDFAAAPARGLTLVGVDYPPDDQLAARTLVTRDLRVTD